jgi:hypothetical protein
MTIEKMTLEQKNKFFTLLIGKCWHEWKPYEMDNYHFDKIQCSICGVIINSSYSPPPWDFYASLSGFQIIKEHMEKEFPEVWEEYLEWCRLTCTFPAYKVVSQHTIIFNKQLDLTNLITYLLENTEGWGWVMCPDYNPPRDSDWWFGCWNSSNKQKACDCDNGKVKHQALLFAESLKEEK